MPHTDDHEQGERRWVPVNVGDTFYPTPRSRVEQPQETELQPGDLVNILIGPAEGKVGVVVVERNGNYVDYEPYSAQDSIGVQVIEASAFGGDINTLLVAGGVLGPDTVFETSTRWFDDTTQLELVYREPQE